MKAIACALVALGIGMSAFGAHSLRGKLTDSAMTQYQTASQYHLWGSLALVVLCVLLPNKPNVAKLKLAGIFVFCATVYGLALGGPRWLGAITPVGGTLMIASWLWASYAIYKEQAQRQQLPQQ